MIRPLRPVSTRPVNGRDGEAVDFWLNRELNPLLNQIRDTTTTIVDSNVYVTWFGGSPTAKFFDPATGRWCKDSGLSTEADDDAVKFQAANDYIAGLGGGTIIIPPGNWYFKTRQGAQGEFVAVSSNVYWRGDGDASCITVAPGMNTAAAGGYTCVLGRHEGNSISNVGFARFKVDHNSQFNQWPSNNYAGVANPQNATVMVSAGDNITAEYISVVNHNGIFAIYVANYNRPDQLTNYRVEGCRIAHVCDDPKQGDVSLIAAAGTRGLVRGNRIDYGGAANVSFPSGSPGTGIEVHGAQTVLSHNVINGVGTGVNVVADNHYAEQISITDNVIKDVLSGITIFQIFGQPFRRLTISGNLIQCRASGDPANPEHAIQIAGASALGQPTGLGLFDVNISENTIIGAATPTANSVAIALGQSNSGGGTQTVPVWTAAATVDPYTIMPNIVRPTVANGYYYVCRVGGVTGGTEPTWPTTFAATVADGSATWFNAGALTGTSIETGSGYTIHDNKIFRWAGQGIIVAVASPIGTGGLCKDVHITENRLLNVGNTGIVIGGSSASTSADFIGLELLNNTIVDDRGGGSALQYGINIAGWLDATSIYWGNRVVGYTSADITIDTVTFPSTTSYWPQERFDHIRVRHDNIQATTEFAGLELLNLTAATGGLPTQLPPGLSFEGKYWDGAASQPAEAFMEFYASATPGMALVYRLGGAGPWSTAFVAFLYPLSTRVGWSAGVNDLWIDQTAQTNGKIQEQLDAGGTWKVVVGGAEKASVDTNGLHFAASTTAIAPVAGAAGALPATPAGYLTVYVNGSAQQIAYY